MGRWTAPYFWSAAPTARPRTSCAVRDVGSPSRITPNSGRSWQFWQSLKLEAGAIPLTPPPPKQFTREEQTRKLADALETALARS